MKQLVLALFLCVAVEASFSDISLKFATPCVTPNDDEGLCIAIQKCKRFMDEILSGRKDSYPFFLESQCGAENEDLGQPRVCCGRYTNFIYNEFATPCITPNKDEGRCIEIQKCKKFMDEIASGRNDSYPFILESRCGPENEDAGQPKVCCGRYTNFIYEESPVASTTQRPPPSSSLRPENDLQSGPFPKVCGNESLFLVNRIFGGEESGIGDFPWMGRLRHRRKDGLSVYGCAGFLIAEKFVLTAAHCIKSKEMEPYGPVYQVQLGEHDTTTDPDCTTLLYGSRQCADTPQLLRAAKPIVHPEYSNNINHYNDIALIPLKEPAVFTDFVFPICLAQQLSSIERLWLSGWGKTESKDKSTVKLKVDIPRVSTQSCVNLYRNVNVQLMTSNQFCAGGEEGRDSCSGDSGGPIMVYKDSKWYAEGIVSFGMGCGLKYWPGVYTGIPPHIPWIRKMMNRYLRMHDKSTY